MELEKKQMKKVAIIPVYNGEEQIKSLIRRTRKYVDDLVVVDDGSTDKTAKIAEKEKAIVIRHEKNRGKGASLQTGIDYILGRDYELVIMMDADGQHRPEEIPKFIRHYKKTQAPVIVGNRMKNPQNMPLIRKLTNRVMSAMLSKICGQSIPDSQCGYKLISKGVFEEIKLLYSNYEIESEILIRASRKGFKIDSVPIATVYQQEKSYINPILDTARFIKLLINVYRVRR
jgi:glycosyltransferase involved in cell wall biosynthesis